MVDYQLSDVLAMTDFALAWRITDSRWSALPDSLLHRIKPLAPAKSKELFESSPLRGPLSDPPDFGRLHATRRQSLEESGASREEDDRIRRWFRDLPIDHAQEVYLCWGLGDGVGAITDWGTFTEIWDDLWYPFDRLCVFDETRQWAVLFGPEEDVLFLEESAQWRTLRCSGPPPAATDLGR